MPFNNGSKQERELRRLEQLRRWDTWCLQLELRIKKRLLAFISRSYRNRKGK